MAQFVRPTSDYATGSWTTTPLWSKIEEGVASNDDTIIICPSNSENDYADFACNSVTDPGSSTGHILRADWNYYAGTRTLNATMELWQGVPGTGTLIATLTSTQPTADTIYSYTLSSSEANSITDYTDLYLRLYYTYTGGGAPTQMEVDAIEFEVPDASTDRAAQVSAFEVQVDDAPRAAQVSAFEVQLDDAPRAAQVSAFELEVPTPPVLAGPILDLNEFSGTSGLVFDTSAIVLQAGKTYLIGIGNRTSGENKKVSTVVHDPTGTPLSFSQLTDGSTGADAALTSSRNVEIWAVTPASTTSSAVIRITFAAGTDAFGADWILFHFDDPVDAVQVTINEDGSGTSATGTLSTFSDTDNVTLFEVFIAEAQSVSSVSPDEGRSELAEGGQTQQYHQTIHYQNPNGSDTSLTATLSVTESWSTISVELGPLSSDRSAQVSAFEVQVDDAPRAVRVSAFEVQVDDAPRTVQVSAFEFEVPTAPRSAQISAFEVEVPNTNKARVSAFEFEIPTAPRKARVSAWELEVPTAPRSAQISAFDVEVPTAPRAGRISAFEIEVPNTNKARISAFEVQVDDAPRQAQISAFEFEVPDAPRSAQISAFEVEVPDAVADRTGRVSAFEVEAPDAPRSAQISAFETELPDAPRKAQVSAFDIEIPTAPRQAQISAFELEVPNTNKARISAFEAEVPTAPRKARISALDLEAPTGARAAQISAFEVEIPTAPRLARVSALELETPDAGRAAQISAFEVQVDTAPRSAIISAFEFEAPGGNRMARLSAFEIQVPSVGGGELGRLTDVTTITVITEVKG